MASDDFATMPGHFIRRLNQRSTAVFHENMKAAPVELTSVQFAALDALGHAPGIDQAQLAALIFYDRATIGEVVKRLVQKGLVTRRVSDQDRRSRRLELSATGRAVLEQTRPLVAALQSEILGNLDREERAQFTALLRKAVGSSTPQNDPDQTG